jgi:hypothetical protein
VPGRQLEQLIGFKSKARMAAVQQPDSEGGYDGRRGFTFDCIDGRQTESYNTCIKELDEYLGRTYTYGGDICWTLENEKMFPVPCPTGVVMDDGAMAKHIWERRIN